MSINPGGPMDEMQNPPLHSFDDGKTKVLGEIGEESVQWTAGDNPLIITCRECFDDRARDHGKCFDPECDCWCMVGKQWPIWALFGLQPPEGSAHQLTQKDEAREETPAPAAARSRPTFVLAGVAVTALAIVVVMLVNLATDRDASTTARGSPSAISAPGVQEQVTGLIRPDAGSVVLQVLEGGLKMPDKPKPNWLRPDKDGICRHPKTGEELRTQAVLRGSCWYVSQKLPGDPSCPSDVYDPPPEVMKEKKLEHLREACFRPWEIGGRSIDVHLGEP